MTPLQKAAQQVIEQWDAPLWKNTISTAHFIGELRKALEAEQAQAGKSFAEVHPANPSATCKCEHWQSCAECHPTANPAQAVEPKCVARIEVFGKDWKLDYLSLPVGVHELYAQTYTYTHPAPPPAAPSTSPLPVEQIQSIWNIASKAIPGWSRHIAYARAIEAAHKIKGAP